MKKICFLFALLILCIFPLSSCQTETDSKLSIVALNFPAYDFAKNIVGDKGIVTLLLPPGGESHTYEPTAKDVMRISECDIFIYNGSESDTWVEKLLSSLENRPKTIEMTDFVTLLCFDDHTEENHEHHHEFDEHVWTSLKNSSKIIDGLCREISFVDPVNSGFYKKNAKSYISRIDDLDKRFEALFENSERDTIVVADRFPFGYFINDYNLHYLSAYHSCTEDSEPTPKVIGKLIDYVKKENVPVIFCIEFSNRTVASAVAEDTAATIRELHSCHNVTKKQLSENVTYLDLMEKNYTVLKEAVEK